MTDTGKSWPPNREFVCKLLDSCGVSCGYNSFGTNSIENMADPPINMTVTGVTGGWGVGTSNVVGINHGVMNTYVNVVQQPSEKIQGLKGDAVHLLPEEYIQLQRLEARTREEIEFSTTGMIRVSAVEDVLDKLKSGQRWVTITGNAGDGKTTLGYLVLKEFLHQKVNVFTVYKPEDYDQIEKMKEDRVIMFDDRFGAFLADQQLIKSWLDVIRKFLSFLENEKLKLYVIFISRKNVVNESRVYLGKFSDEMFNPKCVVDLSVRKVTEERLEILDYHLQHEKVTVNVDLKQKVSNKDMAHGFPHCCKMYSKLRSNGYDVDIEEFFESPLTFLDMTTKVLYKDNCKDLFQLMIKNDGKFDVYNVKDEDTRQKLLQVEKEQEGSYITVWRNGTCQFAHPSVYESVLNVINDIDPLYCVQYATLSVIRQKMIISTSDEEDRSISPCYIVVKPIPVVLKTLTERFREEILKGDYSVFTHRLCESKEFCHALVSCCITSDEKEESSKQFINKPGKDGYTMLWTALKSGGMTVVQTLLTEAKADVTIQDERGRTPLQYICQLITNTDNVHHTHMEIIRIIITEGRGDVNIRDQYGQSPLHYLFKWGNLTKEYMQWIITEGKGDLNASEQNKSTPLHYLCANPSLQLDTVDLVVKEGKGDFNKGDEYGTTPFHYLCRNVNVDFDTVAQIINSANGDINKRDENGITPYYVFLKRDNADRYGNTTLDFQRSRGGINHELGQGQLEQIPETDMTKQIVQDDCQPGADGMIDRSAPDLVLCRFNLASNCIVVLGRAMILNSERVSMDLQVEDFGQVLTNMEQSGRKDSAEQFSRFIGTCSSPFPLPTTPYPLTRTPSYWETGSTMTWNEGSAILLQSGVVQGKGNLDQGPCISFLPGSVCVSVRDICSYHNNRLCIQVVRRDQEEIKGNQVGECVSLPLPTPGEIISFTFGLVLDVGRGRIAFIDVDKGMLLCRLDVNFIEEVFPMVNISHCKQCLIQMRLVSGREISVTDEKKQLIQQALCD